jgi:hypothetical protein
MVKAENYWLWIAGGGLGKSVNREETDRMQQRDEDKLQMALWELICMRKKDGVLAWAVCNNPRSARDGARYKKMGMVAGCPDLHFLVNGRYQTLEVKTEKGRPSLAQLAWRDALLRRNLIADIGFGWDQCVEILERRGVLLPGRYGRSRTAWDVGEPARAADPGS